MAEHFPHMFNASDLGKSLKEVSTNILHAPRQDVVSRWFHSAKDADLFIWTDMQHNILKQQLSYYGQIVEWNVVEGLKTGHVVIDETEKRQKGSEILHFDQKPVGASVSQALALVEHVTGLRDLERQALLRNFSVDGPSVHISPEEFVARFGAFLERPKPAGQESASPLKRLVTRLQAWFKS